MKNVSTINAVLRRGISDHEGKRYAHSRIRDGEIGAADLHLPRRCHSPLEIGPSRPHRLGRMRNGQKSLVPIRLAG